MSRPAVVTEKSLKTRFLDAGLVVNGNNRTRRRLCGGFERGGHGTEIERSDGSAVTGLQQRLVFGRGEEQLSGSVGVVVQQLDARNERTWRMQIGGGFGANEIAPRIGAEVRGINSAEKAMPIGVVALCP